MYQDNKRGILRRRKKITADVTVRYNILFRHHDKQISGGGMIYVHDYPFHAHAVSISCPRLCSLGFPTPNAQP